MTTLDKIHKRILLINAINQMSAYRKRGRILWPIVADLCGVGCTSANEICRELGWNPNQLATTRL